MVAGAGFEPTIRRLPDTRSKQVAMCSRSCQCEHEDIFLNIIDQKPVRLYMTLTMPRVCARKRMVTITFREGHTLL